MLVRFEQVDRPPIWINPDHVDSVGYRMEGDIDAGQFVPQIIAGWTEIGMASDSGHGYVVLGTPEEVVAKLFPQTQAQAMKERLVAITESLKDEVQVNPQRTCLTCKWYEGAEVPWANCKFPLPSLPLVITDQLVYHWTPDLAATNCPTWEAKA
jgi:hypothetical protein